MAVGNGTPAEPKGRVCKLTAEEFAFPRGANLERVASQFRHQVIAGTDGERHDGQGGVLARIRSEAGSVHDKKILNVVGLLELIEDGFFRVGTHAGDTSFVKR